MYPNHAKFILVIINCQSVMSMRAELGSVIDSTNPDSIVEAREIWLSSSIAISLSDFVLLNTLLITRTGSQGT